MKSEISTGWYSVRTIVRHADIEQAPGFAAYEERITLWRAESFEHAIELGEKEATEYAELFSSEYCGLAQAYLIDEDIEVGSEVFSLMRHSSLGVDDYVSRFFDTGQENEKSL